MVLVAVNVHMAAVIGRQPVLDWLPPAGDWLNLNPLACRKCNFLHEMYSGLHSLCMRAIDTEIREVNIIIISVCF